MTNPFLLEAPALVSFSGGRTSGYMLRRIIEAHGGRLPRDVIPCFANTGKEMPQTLDFVEECGIRWGATIVWLEYDPAGERRRKFRVVDRAAAGRNGEPYEALIRERRYLPNPVTRFCTEILKIRVMRDYALSLGWRGWTTAVGLRRDEPRRVAKIRAASERWEKAVPLFDAGVTKAHVSEFWASQPFDLGLPDVAGKTPYGNCDLCFLKSAGTISSLIAEEPGRADWWSAMEALALPSKPSGARFRDDRPGYAEMKDAVLRQRRFDFGESDALAECYCHD